MTREERTAVEALLRAVEGIEGAMSNQEWAKEEGWRVLRYDLLKAYNSVHYLWARKEK